MVDAKNFNFSVNIGSHYIKNKIMSKNIRICRGLDIPLKGQAKIQKKDPVVSEYIAIKPSDFLGITPKLVVKENDRVLAGDVIFIDKHQPELCIVSPVSGQIKTIERGAQRKILNILIQADSATEYRVLEPLEVGVSTSETVKKTLLNSGLWAFINQRPFDILAQVDSKPKGIFISSFDTHPLAPSSEIVLAGQEKYLQIALDALSKIAPVHLSVHQKMENLASFESLKNVQIHHFSGPHPAGNVGVQIHHIDPINKSEVAWTLDLFALIVIGKRLLENRYDVRKTIAVTGSALQEPFYVETVIGTAISTLVEHKNKHQNGSLRYISGNPLTGENVGEKGYLGFYHSQITVLPEGLKPKFFLTEGWLSLGLNRFSNSRLYPSFLTPNKQYEIDTNLNGEERAFVVTGELERVFPFDILPMQLIKSAMYGDIEEMENLGIYEVAPEDFALCEYVCTSKLNIQQIIREGLEKVQKS